MITAELQTRVNQTDRPFFANLSHQGLESAK